MSETKLTCRHCGAAMNHHASKIEYGTEEREDVAFEGVLKDVYTCPKCGAVEMITAN